MPKNSNDKRKNAAAVSKDYKDTSAATSPFSQARNSSSKDTQANSKPPTVRIGGTRYEIDPRTPGNKNYSVLGTKDFKKIAAGEQDMTLADIRESLIDQNYRLSPKAKDFFVANKNTLNQPTKEANPQVTYDGSDKDGDGKPDTPPVGADPFEWQAYRDIALGGLQKETATESETIRGKSNEEIAKIQRGQSDYAQDAETKRSFYSDDSEERWRKFASTTDKEKAIEVQKIVAAGLKDVAEIEGGYSLKGVQAKGEADKAVMGIRAQADKDISRMDNTSRMYSLLGLAFG